MSAQLSIAYQSAPLFLARGANWLLRSGIQEPEGGVARFHRTNLGRNAGVSTEITGYFVSSALDLHERTGNGRLLEAARCAGEFLCGKAWDPAVRAMPFEWPENGEGVERLSYFFDNGIITRGLVRLWRATGEEGFLEGAVRCGESMRADFVNARDIDPVLELPSKSAAARDERWSRQPGCYQLKSAMGWLALAAATGEMGWRVSYERTLQMALASHEGFLAGETGDRVMDRLHAYCYFLEGLLPVADRPEAQQALETGIARVAGELRRMRERFERSDVGAQLLRVRLWAESLGAVKLDEPAARQEAGWVESYQMEGGENTAGGFCFGSRERKWTPFVNPVSTAFCLQALALWRDRQLGVEMPDWRKLV